MDAGTNPKLRVILDSKKKYSIVIDNSQGMDHGGLNQDYAATFAYSVAKFCLGGLFSSLTPTRFLFSKQNLPAGGMIAQI